MTRTPPPEGLSAAGLAAWGRALRVLERTDEPDLHYDAASRYAFAVDLAVGARRAWQELGEPLTVANPNGAEGVHPVLKVIRDAEHDARRFGEALGLVAKPKGRPGRKPEAVVRPIGERVTRRDTASVRI